MQAARLARSARRRKGLTQRELAARTGIPQPMISAIERGLQDPRHGTLERILRACDLELDLVNVAGIGVDRTMFPATLTMTPGERLRYAVSATHAIDRMVKSARRVR